MIKSDINPDKISIQLVYEKQQLYWDSIKKILSRYPSKFKSQSIKKALDDFNNLFEVSEMTYNEILKVVSKNGKR